MPGRLTLRPDHIFLQGPLGDIGPTGDPGRPGKNVSIRTYFKRYPVTSPPKIQVSFIVFRSPKYTQQNNEKNFHEQKFSLNRYFSIIIIIIQRSEW